jgi:integrase
LAEPLSLGEGSGAVVEQIRGALLADDRIRDAALVSVLAYAGSRPGEALGLTWRDVGKRTILVERAAALGEIRETTRRQTRSVRLLAPLARDLREWRLKCGRPDEDALIFPRYDGGVWNEQADGTGASESSRLRPVEPGLDRFRPYDLRHSFVSLLFAEGRTVIGVARQAGHSPTMALATYGHVIEGLEGAERHPAEDVLREARARRVPSMFPQHPHSPPGSPQRAESCCKSRKAL